MNELYIFPFFYALESGRHKQQQIIKQSQQPVLFLKIQNGISHITGPVMFMHMYWESS